MSEKDHSCVRGDTTSMPNRGTRTNVPGNAVTSGRDLGPSAKNRLGSAHTPSDKPADDTPNGGGELTA